MDTSCHICVIWSHMWPRIGGGVVNVQNNFIAEWVRAGGAPNTTPSYVQRDELRSKVRVLIADDYPDAAQSLSLLLMSAGCETRIAYDGGQALAIANAWHPHVSILDLSMPKLDGCELARRLREPAWGQRCLLIAVTGWTATKHARDAQSAGFDCCFRKPVEPDEILRTIRKRSLERAPALALR